MSPEALQSHSLPSSVSDALEAMVGGGLDDLTLEDIDPSNLAEEQQSEVSCNLCVHVNLSRYNTKCSQFTILCLPSLSAD